jgi:hypothetical protein
LHIPIKTIPLNSLSVGITGTVTISMQVHRSTSGHKADNNPTNNNKENTGKETEPTFTLYKCNRFEATFANVGGKRTVTRLDYLAIFLEIATFKVL